MKRILFLLTILSTAHAQTHRVETAKPVVRAVGVYEWTGDLTKPTAARFVPVTIYIDGDLHEAGTYNARPIPLALLNGNIYSLENSGVPQGTLTLEYARHLQANASNAADTQIALGWFGYGTYAVPPPPRKTPILSATTVHGITSSKTEGTAADAPVDTAKSDRPHFGRKPATDTTTVTPATSDDDPDRPHLSKAPASADATNAPKTAAGDVDGGTATTPVQQSTRKTDTTSPTPPEDDTDRPSLRRRDPKQAEADRKAAQKLRERGSVSGIGDLNADPDRPTMKRGAPAGSGGAPAALVGLPAALHQSVAVSDAVNREPHPFRRDWDSPLEQNATLAALNTLAQPMVAQYAKTNGLQISATSATTPSTPRRPRAKIAAQAISFVQQQVDGFTLSYGGLPTFLFTAKAATAPQIVGRTPPLISIAVIAQRQPSGELQVALTSITDDAHLDRTPLFRFIDVVDADASNRASLLFELRGQTSRQFALYRILAARAEQTFITNPTN